MDYFPLFARIENTHCLVVGGGNVAARKIRALVNADARVTICAPQISEELQQLALDNQDKLRINDRKFTAADVDGAVFVVAATDNEEVNKQVAAAAKSAGILCNVVDNRELSTAILPAVVDRSPLIVAVSSSGEAPVLATRVRQQIEKDLAPRAGELALFMGRWRDKVKELITAPDARRHFWQKLLDSPVAQLILDNRSEEAESGFRDLLDATQSAADNNGMGFIVGAGPGDPELLTLKALRILGSADVILYDRLVNKDILGYARKDAEFIYVGKQAGKPSTDQQDINALLTERVSRGQQVCRLKGGDPFVFGRGGEELEALLEAGLPWQVVPGITAAAGCAAAAGIPLTHRDTARSLTYTTAHHQDDSEPDWSSLAGKKQTAVFYMPVSKLDQICSSLVAAGRSSNCPAVIIENGSTPQQRSLRGTLADLAERARNESLCSPALLIVGEVAAKGVNLS
jgi:uroporphyrin-III C-methyltransferase/precorrin-2 dehydrogenase/sirohydrochlorin ferrochelatase